MFSQEELTRARALFPFTAGGRVYLNHASTSPLSTRVVRAMTGYLHERSEGILETYHSDLEMVSRLRSSVGKMIGAESPDRIAFQPNTSDAINIVAAGMPWKAGDRIILNDLEFPANVYPFLHVKRLGVELDVLGSRNGIVTPEMIRQAITPRTRLVALSAVQFLSGHRADLAAIGSLCRPRGIVFAVDAIQAVGAVRINVQACMIDALAAGSQKWQMAPHGSGFLYITEELQSRLDQKYLGWFSVEDPWDFRNFAQPLARSARRYEGGSLIMPSLWGLDAALSTLLEFGTEAIENHILDLTGMLTDGLARLPEVRLTSPTPRNQRAGIVTVLLPSADPKRLLAALEEAGIMVSLREGKIRYSPHFYNTAGEMEKTIDVTRHCLARR